MKKQRLLKLADFLENLKPRQFNLATWTVSCGEKTDDAACGTVACACGWATTIPSFRRAGFRLARRLSWTDPTPVFGRERGWDAVKAFFDMNYGEANHLFSIESYSGGERTRPQTVAKRIRQVVEHGFPEDL
jgi:hypothetical protein